MGEFRVETPAEVAGTKELRRMEQKPELPNNNRRKNFSKQLSTLKCESRRDISWEKRRRRMLKLERRNKQQQQQQRQGVLAPAAPAANESSDDLSDEDLNELKGSIELGFGFNEEDGQKLCNTLPALDFYFAVNRRFSTSPLSSPSGSGPALGPASASAPTLPSLTGPGSVSSSSQGSLSHSSSFDSPRSDLADSWKICTPGDSPQQVKTKLRHWAQAVACSVMQSH